MGKRDYKYKKIDGKNEIMILKYEGHETNLSIPGYIDEYPVTQIEDFAFEEWLTGFEETMIWFADYSEPDISKLLITINIPYTIKIIKSNAFVCYKYLVNINVDNYNDYFSSQDGILYNKDCTMIIKYPSQKNDSVFYIPETVEAIQEKAFFDCSNLKKIVLNKNVKIIGFQAFYFCNLEEIVLNNNLEIIDDEAFCHCSKLKKIIIPRSVQYIEKNAFYRNVSDLTFYVYNNSYGLEYVRKNNFNYKIIH